ncbi:MAG: TIGR03663 family protein [Anaerolineae bacterium]|nr:TIGR03663 family protein [Anaerolineae bacterium]MDW8067934.1 TIGR03663 family protein [Anaerolineae bacterium]
MAQPETQPWLDRPILTGIPITREQGLYLLLLLVCLISRLVMLGYRVQTHDESLHCKFSWDLYAGLGFQHNPMMHGPLEFHATALMFFLFGDSDFTARLFDALSGVVLVAFPYFMRRWMGRWGALLASFLLLISPSISYYSRHIRQDIPCVLFAVWVLWAVFRYLEEGRDRHLYILAAALSLMFAVKETAFIYTAIFGLFLVGLLVVQAQSQPWERPGAKKTVRGALIGLAVGLLLIGVGLAGREANLALLIRLGGGVVILSLLVGAVALPYGLWPRRTEYRTLDLIFLIGTLTLPFLSPIPIHGAAWLAARLVERAPHLGSVPFWLHLSRLHPTDYTAPAIYYSGVILALTIAAAVALGLLWDRRRWPIAAAIHTGIFLVLFTTVFTNGAGIASGWVGSLGYWLEQQEVQRGGQPWFYYLVILPMYDFLPLIGFLSATLFLVARAIRNALRPQSHHQSSGHPSSSHWSFRHLFILSLLIWSFLSWFGYSYAGEKMPWLVVHITTPMALLSGWLLGLLIEVVEWETVWKRYGWLMVLLLPMLVAAAATLAQATQSPLATDTLENLLNLGELLGGIVGVLILSSAVVYFWVRVGWRNGLLLTGLTIFLLLSLLTIRIAHRLNFVNYDRPAEFLVYAHEGPDVRTAMQQIEELSLRVAGGPYRIDVAYGPDGSWPFIWYLRNYPNARYYPDKPTRDQVLATVIIVGQQQWGVVEPYLGDDYYRFDYFFLWWPIEDYRRLTGPKLWEWLTEGKKRLALWRIFYAMDYRLYDEITGGKRVPEKWPMRQEFRLYIRKDVVDRLWEYSLGPKPPEEETAAPDPYAAGWRALAPIRTWGSEGSDPGQFLRPRGIAVAPDGSVYVADSGNHRIQKFTAAGEFITAWGSFGGCPDRTPPPGTFCEPWGVAVGPDGAVYVADLWAHRVQKFSPDGEFLAQWGFSSNYGADLRPGAFYGPRGIAVAPDGSVYVTDTGNKRVQVFTADGTFVRMWGSPGSSPGQLSEPVGIALGPDGNLYVADTWNYRVQVLNPLGKPIRQWPIAGWNNPAAEEKPYLAVDRAGRVYVTDPGHYRVLAFSSEGEYLYSFGQFGFEPTAFVLPMGVAVGPEGDLYITDAGGHRIAVFRP